MQLTPVPDPLRCVENSVLFLQGPVFFYYGLSNYFQNYRKYGVSKDDNQLTGDLKYFKVS